VHAYPSGRRVEPRAWTAVRRFGGPVADELFVVSRPAGGPADAARQAEAVYEGILDALDAEDAGPEAIVTETVFLRGIRDHLPAVRFARARVLAAPATTFIGQAPLARNALLEVAVAAVLPHPPSAHEVTRPVACAPGATVVRLGEETSLHAGNVHGSGRDAFAEAYDMFRVAEDLVAEAGMQFADVIRTWIHVRDIGRDYEALNRARRQFFRDRGVGRLPASTGVQGIPFPDAHAFSLSLQAIQSPRPLAITPMSAPSLNEAWSYGADFSRGLRVVAANGVTLHVSGTASIDEAGRTAHVGDFAAQVDRMLHNIGALLERQGASFADVVSGVTYLRDANDAPALRSIVRARGFDGFPCALVETPLCRREMLCEAEVVAILPAPAAEA
jgi:enamine deaminase RidA (YjgF/YER057c/UK114 family)